MTLLYQWQKEFCALLYRYEINTGIHIRMLVSVVRTYKRIMLSEATLRFVRIVEFGESRT